jgi:hypothetical protein
MAAEKVDIRDVNFRQVFPWTEVFRGFQVALDPKKLVLAALGLLVMAFGWWVLAVIFYNSRAKPDWNAADYSKSADVRADEWRRFKEDRRKWNLLYEAAGPAPVETDAYDLADGPDEVDAINEQIAAGHRVFNVGDRTVEVRAKPYGRMRAWPWFEDRGPNPYLLATGQAGHPTEDGGPSYVPWERGRFWDWLWTRQVPVLIEPLVKFLRPVVYLLHPHAGFWNRGYFLLALVWALATWALFGGAITRMAAVQVARKEKIGMGEALRFTLARYLSFLSAPLFPLVLVAVVVLCLVLFGFFHLIPAFGDIIVDGLGWPLVILAGLAMAVVLVGLVGWPMMYATISAEGSDSFDAISRSYSYVYQGPWHYIWYALVALAYGAVVVFFVGFMGSLMVYLGKWGVSQTPFTETTGRDPQYLFIYAPTSFGWRDLLLQDSPAVTSAGTLRQDYVESMRWYNYAGAALVALWLYVVFMMVVGFAYSYFWSASTIIYLLMRRKVDDTELDEVYLEDDEVEDAYPGTSPVPAAAPAAAASPLTMVEPPALKTNAPLAPAPAGGPPDRAEPAHKEQGDGNPPPAAPAP